MRLIFWILLSAQTIVTFLAVLFNLLLVMIILMTKTSKIGIYKYIMAKFAIFEALYAVAVFLGMPMHYVADRTWIEFSHFGVLAYLGYPNLGPVLYCLFFQCWIAFIVVHFTFRYAWICRRHWISKLSARIRPKIVLLTIFAILATTIAFCAIVLCTVETASEKVLNGVKTEFDIDNETAIGYYIIRLTKLDGTFSPVGIITFINHYIGVYGSLFVIGFCSLNIWLKIKKTQKIGNYGPINILLEMQLFKALILQTAVPIVFCHIPSMIVLTFPLWESDTISIEPITTIFPVLLTLTKMIDPLLPLYCILAYRRTLISLFCGQSSTSVAPYSIPMTFSFRRSS